MFCHITENWRARPLESRAVVVNCIANTTTKKGLKIGSALALDKYSVCQGLDENEYETGLKITDEEMNKIAIEGCQFHGEWNYKICAKTN